MTKRSHLISVAKSSTLEALRCDGHRTPEMPSVRVAGPCISGTDCPDYALRDDLPYGDGTTYCSICGTRYPELG